MSRSCSQASIQTLQGTSTHSHFRAAAGEIESAEGNKRREAAIRKIEQNITTVFQIDPLGLQDSAKDSKADSKEGPPFRLYPIGAIGLR